MRCLCLCWTALTVTETEWVPVGVLFSSYFFGTSSGTDCSYGSKFHRALLRRDFGRRYPLAYSADPLELVLVYIPPDDLHADVVDSDIDDAGNDDEMVLLNPGVDGGSGDSRVETRVCVVLRLHGRRHAAEQPLRDPRAALAVHTGMLSPTKYLVGSPLTEVACSELRTTPIELHCTISANGVGWG